MLTNREMQCLGAAYLQRFCSAHCIEDVSLDELISHLLNIICASDLPAWETEGGRLTLCGRGDPMPEHLSHKLPGEQRNDFGRLIEHVVEIGIVDMYGANTDGPAIHLEEARQILEANDLVAPSPDLFRVQPRPIDGSWGNPIPTSEFDSFVGEVLSVAR